MPFVLIFLLACLLELDLAVFPLVEAASDIDSKPPVSIQSSTMDAQIRDEFLKRVQEAKSLSADKGHWIQVYVGLTKGLEDTR
ncbi:MAG TPA: hypothetical protein VJ692_11415, partial [Nitrospiraceae bacterium]|nr:hypothetical protein [Nitrospiraceae bacterium]